MPRCAGCLSRLERASSGYLTHKHTLTVYDVVNYVSRVSYRSAHASLWPDEEECISLGAFFNSAAAKQHLRDGWDITMFLVTEEDELLAY